MYEERSIVICQKWKTIKLDVSKILYVLMHRQVAEIRVFGGLTYYTRMPMIEIKEKLGNGFIEVRRGCLASTIMIEKVDDMIHFVSGDSINYSRRRKREICAKIADKKKMIIDGLKRREDPKTVEEYKNYYRCYENAPFAFADIEMVFGEEEQAVDWIFRYGNPQLSALEKVPLEELIGSSFGGLFDNMSSKWLRAYERAVLYDEVVEINEYSPEIDMNLKVICFPTFNGHCGCILFDVGNERPLKNGLKVYGRNLSIKNSFARKKKRGRKKKKKSPYTVCYNLPTAEM